MLNMINNQKAFVQVYVQKDIKNFLKEEAKLDKRSLSSFISKILDKEVNEIKKDKYKISQ